MQIHIHTGDDATDALLQAALPLWEARLTALSGDGTVCILSDTGVTEQTADEASVLLVVYRSEDWPGDPLHKRLTDALPYGAVSWPVSLAAVEKALLQMDTGTVRESHAAAIRLLPEENLVKCGGRSVRLTTREFQLFSVLYEHRGQPVSRDILLAAVWPEGVEGNACEVHMTHLRRKLTPILGEGMLAGIRGKGYILH